MLFLVIFFSACTDTESDIECINEGIKIPMPVKLVSGYNVHMSIDKYPKGEIIEHISVSINSGDVDAADAECIAKDILGE